MYECMNELLVRTNESINQLINNWLLLCLHGDVCAHEILRIGRLSRDILVVHMPTYVLRHSSNYSRRSITSFQGGTYGIRGMQQVQVIPILPESFGCLSRGG